MDLTQDRATLHGYFGARAVELPDPEAAAPGATCTEAGGVKELPEEEGSLAVVGDDEDGEKEGAGGGFDFGLPDAADLGVPSRCISGPVLPGALSSPAAAWPTGYEALFARLPPPGAESLKGPLGVEQEPHQPAGDQLQEEAADVSTVDRASVGVSERPLSQSGGPPSLEGGEQMDLGSISVQDQLTILRQIESQQKQKEACKGAKRSRGRGKQAAAGGPGASKRARAPGTDGQPSLVGFLQRRPPAAG